MEKLKFSKKAKYNFTKIMSLFKISKMFKKARQSSKTISKKATWQHCKWVKAGMGCCKSRIIISQIQDICSSGLVPCVPTNWLIFHAERIQGKGQKGRTLSNKFFFPLSTFQKIVF